ncbi:hypothetical protein H072_7326 [Dactylellina haptotyla CBS 200.50]|uniref:Rhodopsin domain-containing protein n=1 Tax=Dactylellina haptotyla (strain CBS 200.50) TaxID=1284197 RepID=S8ACU3_DACHA|nr:hypothetical protein H072_7326 [Dactylellina haptotyla CBS 200.50]
MGQVPSHVPKPTTDERNEMFALFAIFKQQAGAKTSYLTDAEKEQIAKLYAPEYVPPTMNNEVVVLTVMVLFSLLASISLRFYSRYRYGTQRRPMMDDWLVLLAVLSCMAYTAVNLYAFLWGGFGRFTYDLSLKQFDHCLELFVVNFAMFAIANTAVKVSILVLYRRIFDSLQTKMRLVIYILIVIVIIFCPISLFVQIAVCKPFRAFWHLEMRADPTVKCGNGAVASYIVGGFRTVLDLVIFSLPIKHIWEIKNFSIRKKIAITAIFWFGLIACAASILKLVLYAKFEHGDIFREVFKATVAESLEFTSAIIAACMPALLPMLKSVFKNTGTTISKITSGGKNPSATTHVGGGPPESIRMKGIKISHAISQTVEVASDEDDTELILQLPDDHVQDNDKDSKASQSPSYTFHARTSETSV